MNEAGAASGPEAQFHRGAQLMTEASSLADFERAIALIEDSARMGHADALCQVATFEAVGVARPRDWSRALLHLEQAAAQGSAQARGQLGLLAATSGDGGTGAAIDWSDARSRIDIERLLRAPAPEALSDRPRLRVYRGFASDAECQWVIERLRPGLKAALVVDGATGEYVVDPYRSNRAAEVPLEDMDVVLQVLKARISAATRLPEFLFELPQIMHYSVGEEFRPHHDYLDPAQDGFAADFAFRGQRMGTMLVFLNDDFEGGATEFPRAGISFRGRRGDALFFANVTRDGQPDPLTLHAGRPPTQGEKWILSQWIRDRPPAGMKAADGSPAIRS